jgi:hypothetical protein
MKKIAFALKIVFAVLCLAVLVSQLWSMSRWNEARGVYDDICYLRQAHLFQRFGLAGFDTDISRDDDGYLKSKLKEIGFPDWNDPARAPCHNFMPATGKLAIQYPPGVGLVLALFPAGHQVVPMYMLATIAVFGFAWLAIFHARTIAPILVAGFFGCLAIYLMINPVKASFSMAPTVVVCALAGFLTARWLTSPRQGSRLGPLIALGFLLGLAVNFRLANLFLASGYCLFLLVSFLVSRTTARFAQGALFGIALIAGMAPTIISYTVNTGSPLTSTYHGAPDVRPLDFSFSVVWDYLGDHFQVALLALAIAGVVWLLLTREQGARRVAVLTAANLAVNLAFFLTYPIATPYYTIPISLLSLWSLLFARVMVETNAIQAEAVAFQSPN